MQLKWHSGAVCPTASGRTKKDSNLNVGAGMRSLRRSDAEELHAMWSRGIQMDGHD